MSLLLSTKVNSQPSCFDECTAEIRHRFALLGAEITVTHLPPRPMTRWVESLRCPHSVMYFFQPTLAQREHWKHEGTR